MSAPTSIGQLYLRAADGTVYELSQVTLSPLRLAAAKAAGLLLDCSPTPESREPAPPAKRPGKGVRRSTSSGKTLALV